jgi:hypothetical protein
MKKVVNGAFEADTNALQMEEITPVKSIGVMALAWLFF